MPASFNGQPRVRAEWCGPKGDPTILKVMEACLSEGPPGCPTDFRWKVNIFIWQIQYGRKIDLLSCTVWQGIDRDRCEGFVRKSTDNQRYALKIRP
ncbi:Uncharacterised protein [uncultured archaeon]|nr:Uncharacterised protein [uncultured archaeon]